MAYTKTVYKDRNVQYPRRFTQANNGDGTITLTPSPGTVTEAGTPVNALNLNKIENELERLNNVIDNAETSTLTTTNVLTQLPNCKNGTLDVTLQGRTLYKKADGTITDVWESGVTLVSAGENSASLYPDIASWSLSPVSGTTVLNNDKTITITSGTGGYDGIQQNNTAFKPNTMYTVSIKVESNNLTQPYSLIDDYDMGITQSKTGISAINIPAGFTGVYKTIFTTGNTINTNRVDSYVSNLETVGKQIKISAIYFFEGDVRNYVSTVDAKVNRIEILSQSKNLFDKDIKKHEIGSISLSDGTNIGSTNKIRNISGIRVLPNTTFTASFKNGYKFSYIYFYDLNKNFISTKATGAQYTFTTPNNCYYLRYILQNTSDSNLSLSDLELALPQIEMGGVATEYAPYDSNKAEILSTTPWRQWDTTDENGVKTIGSGEVVLNGSESWNLSGTVKPNTMLFYLNDSKYAKVSNTTIGTISDKLKSINQVDGLNEIEGVWLDNTNNRLFVTILKTKLSTQDVAGFKLWLASNAFTVVYQSATPTTENTNKTLNLTAFENGYYQSNSGLVTPSSTIIYPSNIGGSIQTLTDGLDNVKEEIDIMQSGMLSVTADVLSQGNRITALENKITYSTTIPTTLATGEIRLIYEV